MGVFAATLSAELPLLGPALVALLTCVSWVYGKPALLRWWRGEPVAVVDVVGLLTMPLAWAGVLFVSVVTLQRYTVGVLAPGVALAGFVVGLGLLLEWLVERGTARRLAAAWAAWRSSWRNR